MILSGKKPLTPPVIKPSNARGPEFDSCLVFISAWMPREGAGTLGAQRTVPSRCRLSIKKKSCHVDVSEGFFLF